MRLLYIPSLRKVTFSSLSFLFILGCFLGSSCGDPPVSPKQNDGGQIVGGDGIVRGEDDSSADGAEKNSDDTDLIENIPCLPATCAAASATCGTIPDGCGGLLTCGSCQAPQTCGGGGTPNVCGLGSCKPKTCVGTGANCGKLSDGCGNALNCGGCKAPQTCAGSGRANICGTPACKAKTCQALGANCGSVPDGCGKKLSCGACKAPQTCGGGGKANVCGSAACKAKTCQVLRANCGSIPDGCGKKLSCGTCKAPQTCGGGGKANVCGSAACKPKTCQALKASCGSVSDGCGKKLNCGTCQAPTTCGGSGTPNVCGQASCPTFAKRVTMKDIPLNNVSVLTRRAIMVSPLPNKTARIAWANSAKQIQITTVRADGQRIGTDVTVKGEYINGFVAHTDGNALLVRRGTDMFFVRTDLKGKVTSEKRLVGGNTHKKINDKWVDSWGHKGRLVWSAKVKRYAAYFGHNMLWKSGKHQGDILLYLDAKGNKLSGGWGWGCSHSIDVRLAYNGVRFGPVCASDCFPSKSIMFNHKTAKLRTEYGNCSGTTSAQLGGLIPLNGNGFLLAFASTFRNGKKETNNEIGIIHITAQNKLGYEKLVTNSPTIAKSSPQIATYGSNFLMGWLQGRTAKLSIINLKGAMIIKPITTTAPLANGGSGGFNGSDRGDLANLPGGDVIWAVASTSKKLTFVRVKYCQ